MDATIDNLLENLPQDVRTEVFETLCKQDGILIQRINSFGQITPEGEWYNQSSDEWVLLMRGKATLSYENQNVQDLRAGDYVFIPKHKKHRVDYTSDDAIWLAIHIRGSNSST